MSKTVAEIIANSVKGQFIWTDFDSKILRGWDDTDEAVGQLAISALAAKGYLIVGPITMGPPPEPVHCSCQSSRYDGDDGWDRDCPSHGVAVKDE